MIINKRTKKKISNGLLFYVFLSGTKQKDSIQVRNFAGKFKGDWKLECKRSIAAQGKIQGEVTRRLLTKQDMILQD